MKDLIERLIEIVERLRGRKCFTAEEVREMERKLEEAINELSKLLG